MLIIGRLKSSNQEKLDLMLRGMRTFRLEGPDFSFHSSESDLGNIVKGMIEEGIKIA